MGAATVTVVCTSRWPYTVIRVAVLRGVHLPHHQAVLRETPPRV